MCKSSKNGKNRAAVFLEGNNMRLFVYGLIGRESYSLAN